MKIRIYQINDERDENRVRFVNYEHLPRFQGTQEIQSGIYDLVFDGKVDCKDLEDVYRMFNTEHPEGFRGHSLSVSDVIEVQDQDGENSFCFCDSFGFREVEFDAKRCGKFPELETSEQIKVLLVQPGKSPKAICIDRSLEAMQKIVGGDIEEYLPFEDEVALICNEEGKLRRLPLNRAIRDEEGIQDIIAGDFFLAYAPPECEEFESLPDDLLHKYQETFRYPERFYQTRNGIQAVPYDPAKEGRDR